MIRFLKSFLNLFAGLAKTSEQQTANAPPAPLVAEREVITRYVLSSTHYRKTEASVKAAAFLPAPHSETGLETSVFRTATLSENEIWQLGSEQRPDRTIYCRADLDQDAVRGISPLDVVEETSTHPLHSIIIRWPPEKDAQKLLAQELERLARSFPGPGHS
jgi:hypothetical protein